MTRQFERTRSRRRPPAENGPVRIYGIHAVAATLQNPLRSIHRVFATENTRLRLARELERRGVAAEAIVPRDIERELPKDAVHQGALLLCDPLPNASVADLIPGDREANGRSFVIVLDQVTDPHNVGAILRSAAAFGARGLVMTTHHSPPLEGALAKAASGGLEHVKIALVPNLARALEQLGEAGYFRIGLAGEANQPLEDEDEDATGPIALVLGAEESGLRRLTREHCDRLCRITTRGAISTLNVSNAAAVAMHILASPRH
jgi:23S rRNA (guanosine2251-2'-O)-methyltransferase